MPFLDASRPVLDNKKPEADASGSERVPDLREERGAGWRCSASKSAD